MFLFGYRPYDEEEVEQRLRDWKTENDEWLESLTENSREEAIETKRSELEDALIESNPRSERQQIHDRMKEAGHRLSDFM